MLPLFSVAPFAQVHLESRISFTSNKAGCWFLIFLSNSVKLASKEPISAVCQKKKLPGVAFSCVVIADNLQQHCVEDGWHGWVTWRGLLSRNGNCNLVFIACPVLLAGAATSIIFVATKVLLRQNTSFAATKICLSRKTVCRDKKKRIGRDKTYKTRLLSGQKYACPDKHASFFSFCFCDKIILVTSPR